MKLCIDCKNFSGVPDPLGGYRNVADPAYKEPEAAPMLCKELRATTLDYVRGKHTYSYADSMRNNTGKCGPDALWFEPKEEAK